MDTGKRDRPPTEVGGRLDRHTGSEHGVDGGDITPVNTTDVGSSTQLPGNPGIDEVVYIDGFNAYNGMRDAGHDNCRWLDWAAYAATLVTTDDYIVRYFTAVVNTPVESRTRQQLYLRALRAHGGLDIIEGSFMARKMKCPDCSHRWNRPKEQYTDVNIAIAMTHDARALSPTRIFLVSGDSDLVPAVHYAQNLGVEVINIAPPKRLSNDLVDASDALLHVDTLQWRKNQLPNPVSESYRGGRKHRPLTAPDGWT